MSVGRCAIVSIGDEVVAGRIVDTNAPWLAEVLASHGIVCSGMETVSDDPAVIEAALRRWVGRVDLLLTTGGLGPTDDDRTRTALQRVAHDDVERDAAAVASMRARLERSGVPIDEPQLRQADRPVSMRSVPNDNGTAPGIMGVIDGTEVWVLPGPPDELRPMVDAHLVPSLQHDAQRPVPHLDIVAFGLSEAAAAKAMGQHLSLSGAGSIRVSKGLVKMRIEEEDPDRLSLEADMIRDALFPLSLPEGVTTPAEALMQCARSLGLTLAAAESCTGGAIGAALTDRKGASDVFKGSIVTYADGAKIDLLSVPAALLAPDGPGSVSAEVAAAMVTGARRMLHADAAVSVTGIAGPDGGTPAKPVGTVWIATAFGDDVRTRQVLLPGRRDRIRTWTVHAALQALRWHLEGIEARMQWDVRVAQSGGHP